ncbi:MAG: class I SAM-dependent methyltransferase [Rhodopirellula sp.]|nr:class I SAM-dependent methyltransferase [Rhodopirellula sp.]
MPAFRVFSAAIAVVLILVSSAVAQDDSPKQNSDEDARYTRRANHDPNGIGKFYMGREIAHVMGFTGARWLERTEREEEERLTLLVRSLKLKPGLTVADIGAGSGVISMLMADQILPDGKVMAVDIQQEMLDRLAANCKKRGVTNVVPVKGKVKSPNLKPGSVDLIILVDVYHEFEFPYEMTLEMSKSLKPGGRIAWVEYRKEDITVPIKLVHKMSEAQVKREASQDGLGLKFVETIGVLPRQHIVIFEKAQDNSDR